MIIYCVLCSIKDVASLSKNAPLVVWLALLAMMPRKTKILDARHRANNIDSVPFHRDLALLFLIAEKTPISTKVVEGT